MTRLIAVVSTAYCLSGTMADGSGVRAGSVAHNGYPLGTHLTISPSPTGRRRFVVRDRIGWGTELDFWVPTCGQALRWGRRAVQIRRGWSELRARHHRPIRPPTLRSTETAAKPIATRDHRMARRAWSSLSISSPLGD